MPYIRPKKPRLVIETTADLKAEFSEKVRSEGYTVSGLVLRWIRDYLKGKKK